MKINMVWAIPFIAAPAAIALGRMIAFLTGIDWENGMNMMAAFMAFVAAAMGGAAVVILISEGARWDVTIPKPWGKSDDT